MKGCGVISLDIENTNSYQGTPAGQVGFFMKQFDTTAYIISTQRSIFSIWTFRRVGFRHNDPDPETDNAINGYASATSFIFVSQNDRQWDDVFFLL